MNLDELRSRLKGICEEQGVLRLDLFGSRAHSPGVERNDYDFIADFAESLPAEYSKRFFGLLHALEDELNSSIDLLTYKSLKKRSLMEKIENDRIPLYER